MGPPKSVEVSSRFSTAPPESEPQKKQSRFSDLCKSGSSIRSCDTALSSLPPIVPQKRKKFYWRDATEEEMREQCKAFTSFTDIVLNEKRRNMDDN